MSKMFPFITVTYNPLAGECSHRCVGCWARALAERHGWSKYQGQPRIDPKQISRRFKSGDFVFVQDMSDLFADNVKYEYIIRVIQQVEKSPNAQFLFLTKNPKRYKVFHDLFPKNCVLGATIETDLETDLVNAPSRYDRIKAMIQLRYTPKMVSIEPIRSFSKDFHRFIYYIKPEFVAVGYDNYNNGFDEPSLEATEQLIANLKAYGIKVIRKTLREAAGK